MHTPMSDQADHSSPPAFELFGDGSFLGLERVLGSLRPDGLNVRQKIVLSILATWVPMLILATVQGMAVGPTRQESFLLDQAMHARFLLAIPLLFYSQKKITMKLRSVVEHFLNAKLVREAEKERFLHNITLAMRSRHSPLVDWLLLLLAYIYSITVLLLVVPGLSTSWRTLGVEGHRRLSLAGWWFIAVSEPIFAFVLFRFVYRIGLWWRFLWQTSRLDLQLDAAHPDGAGGLGFLGLTLRTAQDAAFAISASFAGGLANIVLATGARVTGFKYEILVLVMAIVGLFASPLAFFYGLLAKTKHQGALGYWVLWQAQLRQFDQKWMRRSAENLDMLSVADFSEATDLSSILDRVQQSRLMPFRQKQILPLIFAALLPFVAVLALEIPVEDILKQLLKMAGF